MSRRVAVLAATLLGVAAAPAYAGPTGYSIQASCRFSGVFDANSSTMDLVVSGHAVATAGPGDAPVSTSVTCVISNTQSGGTNTGTTSLTAPGAAAATADVFTNWPALQVSICVKASATYLSSFAITQPLTCVHPV